MIEKPHPPLDSAAIQRAWELRCLEPCLWGKPTNPPQAQRGGSDNQEKWPSCLALSGAGDFPARDRQLWRDLLLAGRAAGGSRLDILRRVLLLEWAPVVRKRLGKALRIARRESHGPAWQSRKAGWPEPPLIPFGGAVLAYALADQDQATLLMGAGVVHVILTLTFMAGV